MADQNFGVLVWYFAVPRILFPRRLTANGRRDGVLIAHPNPPGVYARNVMHRPSSAATDTQPKDSRKKRTVNNAYIQKHVNNLNLQYSVYF